MIIAAAETERAEILGMIADRALVLQTDTTTHGRAKLQVVREIIGEIQSRGYAAPTLPTVPAAQTLKAMAGRFPKARSLDNRITPRQFGKIQAIGYYHKISVTKLCLDHLDCSPEQLTRKAAVAFIGYLQKVIAEQAKI